MKLLLDHHYSPGIAEQLRSRGHDVQAALERGWQAEDDESLLERRTGEGRALLTNNVGDFAVVARRWAVEGRWHPGLIFTSDRHLPRNSGTIGSCGASLDALHPAHPADDGLVDRIWWLS